MYQNQIPRERAHSAQLAKTDQSLNTSLSPNKYQNLNPVFPEAFQGDRLAQTALTDHQIWVGPGNTTPCQLPGKQRNRKVRYPGTVGEQRRLRSEQNAEERGRSLRDSGKCSSSAPGVRLSTGVAPRGFILSSEGAQRRASHAPSQKCLS